MECIAQGIIRHHLVLDICFYNLSDFWFNWQQWQRSNQGQYSVLVRILSYTEFIDNRFTGENLITLTPFVPPLACPSPLCSHLGFCTCFVIETGNRCLDVDLRDHYISYRF